MSIKKFLSFLPTAQSLADKSKDRSTKVGAIALDDDYDILSTGYNGMPRKVDDDVEERHERPMKYFYTAHAEENLVAQAARKGVSLKGSTVLVTSLFPCTTCSRLMIQAGVKRIIAANPATDPRWEEQAYHALIMLTEAGVEIHYTNDIAAQSDSLPLPMVPVTITA